jgi:hypothetical protein
LYLGWSILYECSDKGRPKVSGFFLGIIIAESASLTPGCKNPVSAKQFDFTGI